MNLSKGLDLRITIAGASGFIGENLIKKLDPKYKINGLSRSNKNYDDRINWIKTDLFSFTSTSEALSNTDVAIYLVHSMLPSSKLFQGNFQDTDLLLADNFANACVKNNVQQIIYLGGLVPDKESSKHLDSRKEVEDVLKASGIPLTILRAGMVVGNGGSSFEILKNLVLNLPGMILPKWTKSNTQTVYIEDLVAVISESINNDAFLNSTINVVNGEKISYLELIQQTAKYFDSKILMIPVPINYTSLSKLWVQVFGEADYELVSPLIDSLLCDLPHPKTPSTISNFIKHKTYKSMLENIHKNKMPKKTKRKIGGDLNNVRSIQRLVNLSKLNQEEISSEYISWLPKHMKFLVRAEKIGVDLKFFFLWFERPVLELKKVVETGPLARVKFNIVGGMLSQNTQCGRFEFRIINNGRYALASINDFTPSLPWYIYKFTQAPLHKAVMKAFSKHLAENSRKVK